jgi:hypothetical protein
VDGREIMKRPDPNHTTISFDRLSIRCEKCRQWIDADVHVTGSGDEIRVWCEGCCPCKPVPPVERVGAVVAIQGEQGGLFG